MTSPRVVLGFDTCGPLLGVGLWVDGQVTERVHPAGRGSDTRLLPLAQELLDDADLAVAAVQGVAVAAGPGAFTGLRVGLSTAGGLAQSLQIPVVLADSLHIRALAAGLAGSEREVLAMLDARKGRVYASAWRGEHPLQGPSDVDPEVAVGWMSPGFLATGQGAVVYADAVSAADGVLSSHPEDPGIGTLVRWGADALDRGAGIRARDVRPHYVRAPDAVKSVSRGPSRD